MSFPQLMATLWRWPEKGSWSGSSHSATTEKILAVQTTMGEWEIDKRVLKMGEKITSGSCGDLHRGTYKGQDVAIKVNRSENLNEALGVEFAQEVMILREVQHKNVVRLIGVCTIPPLFCIVTEYMSGENLYDFLHKHNNVLELSQKFAIDISKGMGYLHQNNIIHGDLKTANLLMDTDHVLGVKKERGKCLLVLAPSRGKTLCLYNTKQRCD